MACSPLAIRADHAPGGAATAPYIGGATLVGGLAAVYRLYHPERRDEFERLFLSGQVQYPNLYPASFKHSQAQRNSASPVYPVPRTAQSCKRFPGFIGDGEDDLPHGVRDSLFDWATFELGGKTREALKPLLKHEECLRSGCHKAMHHFPGFYRHLDDGKRWAEMKVKKRLQTHTGINRETGTVQEGILYSREVFAEQACFSGVVKLPDELADSFEKFIAQVGESGLVRVGNGRTRGLGKVALSTSSAEHVELEAFKFERF
jgi:CRISPR-associated Csx10 family RAMP protein